VVSDVWGEKIENFLAEKHTQFNDEKFTMLEIFSDFGPFQGREKDTDSNQKRAGSLLRKLGYEKAHLRGDRGRTRYWAKVKR
jgi:hypothetical protein